MPGMMSAVPTDRIMERMALRSNQHESQTNRDMRNNTHSTRHNLRTARVQNIDTIRRYRRQHQIHRDAVGKEAEEVKCEAYRSGDKGRYETRTEDGQWKREQGTKDRSAQAFLRMPGVFAVFLSCANNVGI